MATFHDHPHPRILFDVPDELYPSVKDMAGWAVRAEEGSKVHLPEFDLALVQPGNPGPYRTAGHTMSVGGNSAFGIDRVHATAASQVNVKDPFEAGFGKLAEQTIVPFMPTGEKQTWSYKTFRTENQVTVPILENKGDLGGRIQPFVTIGTEEYPYAWIAQLGSGKYALVLPPETRDVPRWLEHFIRLLHTEDPDSFPVAAKWTDRDEWSSASASASAAALRSHLVRAAQEIEALSVEEVRLADAAEAARKSDEIGHRRLLTANGDELVDAVVEALRIIGFTPTEMDATHVDAIGSRLEDLRVSLPNDDKWIALAEVKGYTGGAKVNDVSQITRRPVVNYVRETGDEPSVVWHIVNVEREKDPSHRRLAIPNDADLEPLSTQGGTLIDTRDLFRAVREIELGTVTAEDVRSGLVSARTRWIFVSN